MNALHRLLLLCLFAFAVPTLAMAQVDINHADARTLAESLTGIGLVRAEAIVAYRAAHGPFRTIDDLARVQGIGTKTLAANRADIVIVIDDHNAQHPRR